jgi:chemotaxis protein MotB
VAKATGNSRPTDASRRELVTGGQADDRVLRVQGPAVSQPIDSADPRAASNRRISIIVMNREAEDRIFRTAPEAPEAPEAEPSVVTPVMPIVSRTEPAKQAH